MRLGYTSFGVIVSYNQFRQMYYITLSLQVFYA